MSYNNQDSDKKVNSFSKEIDLIANIIVRYFFLSMIVLSLIGLGLIYFARHLQESLFQYVVEQLGTTLLITGALAEIGKILGVKFYDDFIKSKNEASLKNIFKTTIDSCFKTLEAMSVCNVTRIYSNRDEAVEDIKQDLDHIVQDSESSDAEIQIIGISLSDFVRPHVQPIMKQTWDSLPYRKCVLLR